MNKFLLCFISMIASSTLFASNITEKHSSMVIDNNTITPQQKQEPSDKDHLTVTLQYPLFTGSNLSAKAKRFNDIINDTIETEVGQFRALVWAANADYEKITDPSQRPPSGSDITIQYKVLMTTAGDHPLISVLFTIDSFLSGAAHPNLTHRTINFDFKQGDGIAIAELFKPNLNFIPTLNAYSAKKLTKLMGKTQKEMEEANELNYSEWNVTPKGLLVTFDEFAHVFGPQSVLIPYAALKNELNPDSPITPCMASEKNCH